MKKTGDISFSNSSGTRPSSTSNNAPPTGLEESSKDVDEVHGIEDMAMMVWKFVQAAGNLVQGLDSEVSSWASAVNAAERLTLRQDEVKLLRLRTKKHELVIVPDPKYLLVVVHETPPA